jgi:hypothetical protein
MFEVPEDFNLFDDPWDMAPGQEQHLAAAAGPESNAATAPAAGGDSHRGTSTNSHLETSYHQQQEEEGLEFVMEDPEQEMPQQEDMEGEGLTTPQPAAAAKAKAGGRGGGRCKRKVNQITVDELEDLQIK